MRIVGGQTVNDVRVGQAGIVFDSHDENVHGILAELGFYDGLESGKRKPCDRDCEACDKLRC